MPLEILKKVISCHLLINLVPYLLKLLEKCATFKKENAPKFKLSNGNLEAICEFWKPSLQTHSKLR